MISREYLAYTQITHMNIKSGRVEILKDVNLHIKSGELTAVIGPNGAGKSTLLKAILQEAKYEGEISFVNSEGNAMKRPLIGYVPQQLEFDTGSPTGVLDLFAAAGSRVPVWLRQSKKQKEKTLQALKKVRCSHLVNRKLGELSGGELQRVLLALALNPVPQLLLLDEPVSGMDQNGMELFFEILTDIKQEYGMSIILVSHDFTMVNQFADRVILLNRTVECCGTPEEVFSSRKTRDIFDSLMRKSGHEGGHSID